jgi:hypothetical protein
VVWVRLGKLKLSGKAFLGPGVFRFLPVPPLFITVPFAADAFEIEEDARSRIRDLGASGKSVALVTV